MAKGARGGRNRAGQPAPQPTPQPQRGPAKPSSGGGGTSGGASTTAQATQQAAAQAAPQAAQPQQPQPVQQAQPTQTMSAAYTQFVTMNDDQKADVISQTIKQGVPAHLANNDFQKFIYNMNLNDKPDVVSEAQLSKMSGQDIFRTVNNVYDQSNDISYTAPQICKQVMGGRITRVSDNGGSVYGRGIYFANNRTSSTLYGNTRGNVKKTAVMHGKLNSNAKIISANTAAANARHEISRGTKLGKALAKCDPDSRSSIYAMSKGYNVMQDQRSGYIVVLNRTAITMSDSINPM